MLFPSLLLFLLLSATSHAFSSNQRVFVSTPVSHFPKRFVADCLTRTPYVLTPSNSVNEAMTIFLNQRITSAPVVDEARHVVGIVSSFDFLQKEAFEGALMAVTAGPQVGRYAAAARKIAAQSVQDVMTPNPVTVSMDTSMRQAAV